MLYIEGISLSNTIFHFITKLLNRVIITGEVIYQWCISGAYQWFMTRFCCVILYWLFGLMDGYDFFEKKV